MLYGHYTGGQALVGIVENEVLWATNIKFLNDEQEFIHAIELSKSILENARDNDKVNPFELDRYDNFITRVMEALDSLDPYQADGIFTCSFSGAVDLLSQWRGYCQGGHGYCLQYDLNELLKSARTKFSDVNIYPCVYDNAEKRKLIVFELNSHWKRFVRLNTEKARDEEILKLGKIISVHASYFKHPSFSEESEHRLVVRASWVSGQDIKFRVGSMSVIPYIEIPASRDLIKVIRVGPTRDQSLARRGLIALIEAKYENFQFLTDVDVQCSEIPFRS